MIKCWPYSLLLFLSRLPVDHLERLAKIPSLQDKESFIHFQANWKKDFFFQWSIVLAKAAYIYRHNKGQVMLLWPFAPFCLYMLLYILVVRDPSFFGFLTTNCLLLVLCFPVKNLHHNIFALWINLGVGVDVVLRGSSYPARPRNCLLESLLACSETKSLPSSHNSCIGT